MATTVGLVFASRIASPGLGATPNVRIVSFIGIKYAVSEYIVYWNSYAVAKGDVRIELAQEYRSVGDSSIHRYARRQDTHSRWSCSKLLWCDAVGVQVSAEKRIRGPKPSAS